MEMHQHLTFTLDGEVFALHIDSVREVLEYTNITKVPRTPQYMRGVINLRGQAVPVADLRVKFGLEPTKPTMHTCIIIVELQMGDRPEDRLVLGALADSVREVVELDPEHIEPAPKIGSGVRTDFIRGMWSPSASAGARQDGGFLIILDIDRVFSEAELAAAGCLTEAAAA